jgi:hypothetical protein
MPRAPLDLTGKTFGALTVIRRAGSSPKGASLWLCHCARCGRDAVIEGHRLRDKRDCGCAYRESRADLSGQHIGVLQVIRREGSDKHGNILYLCRCDLCGKEKVLPASTIRARLASCGCKKTDPQRMEAMSPLGVAKQVYHGVQVIQATRKEANRNSQTGVRGVFPFRGGYIAAVQIKGVRWRSGRYSTIEEAQKALAVQKEAMLDDAGVTDEVIAKFRPPKKPKK